MPRYNALAGRSLAPRTTKHKETALSTAAAKVPEGMFTILSGHTDAGAIAKARFVDWCRNPEHRFSDWRSAWIAFQEEAKARKEKARIAPQNAERSAKPLPVPNPEPNPEPAKAVVFVSARTAAAAFIDSL